MVWAENPQKSDRPLFAAYDELKRRVGPKKAEWMLYTRNLTVFPNVQFAENASLLLRIMRPLAVDKTEMLTFCVAPKNEDPKARVLRLRQYEDFFNPSGLATPDELEATDDPQNEVSFIFYASRAGLEDRIWRIRSGQSVASMPLPRTAHLVGNIQVEAAPEGLSTTATFVTHVYYRNRRKQVEFFGRHEHLLVQQGLDWKILRRKTYLYNDNIPAVLDIYCI